MEVRDLRRLAVVAVGEAGGSLNRGTPERVGAAATKSGRSSTAGWAGSGEQDGKAYVRNRCCHASSSSASSNPADRGWRAVHTCRSGCKPCGRAGGELSGRSDVLGPAGRGEGLGRSHDDAAGAKPDASPVDRTTVNMGPSAGRSLGGLVRCRLKAAGGAEPS